ncbi:hypothetical protein [Herbiconiux sp. VKM Ac-2851]|uniref:hypothetical protein n=1 Tax=Herbiconiux sp. VKM Ac-2851 TaxID=2739025 RepID=UPI0015671664|nr:hypothetical protein [Herbiconiux sp. VKM Ac-2851]NQX33379.1 hypothetical protein [Herbiconiux sp. VKM Ac-2851]
MSRLHRPLLRRASAALAVVATAAAATLITLPAGALPATAASTNPPLTDPAAVIGRIAPELLDETSRPPTTAEADAIAAEQGARPFELRLSTGDGAPVVDLSPPQTEGAGLPISLTIDDAHGPVTRGPGDAGIDSFAIGQNAAAYVQPLMNGVRLLTALTGPAAGSEFDYTFDLPDGTTRTELPDGDTLLADAAHHYIGTLAAPWARDAAGRDLPTRYEWTGDTLTQHVDLDAQTAYPVLLDPNWYYSYDFSAALPLYSARYPKATELAASHLLHNCFNCSFPIFGAPRGYPVDGQVLNLNASPFSLQAFAAPVKVQTANGGAMQFVALPGHFDGAGSLITFSWYNDPSGYLHLYVHAMVKVDNGPTMNIANSRIAGANWMLFWQRVADHAGASGGGGV